MNEEQDTKPDAPPISALLEALLFQYGEPIAVNRAAGLLGIDPGSCETAIGELERVLADDSSRGLAVLRHGSASPAAGGLSVQLVTKPSCRAVGQAIIEDEFRAELSPAGLEVLTLIAYLGPVLRSTVDYIRGVNSSFTVRNLVVRGLAERDQSASRGNAYAYRATALFLRHLSITRVEDLPDYGAFRAKLAALDQQQTAAEEKGQEKKEAETRGKVEVDNRGNEPKISGDAQHADNIGIGTS